MAVAIEEALGISVELIAGDGGVFDVKVDGQTVFSKQESGYFVEAPEALELIKALAG